MSGGNEIENNDQKEPKEAFCKKIRNPIYLLRLILSILLIIIGNLARYFCLFRSGLALSFIISGVAILLHLVADVILIYCYEFKKLGGQDTEDKPKGYFDFLKFTVNALIITSGLILGLVDDYTDQNTTYIAITLGMGILVGLFHLSVLGGALTNEITHISDDKQESKITLSKINLNFSWFLINLQYILLLMAVGGLVAEMII